MTPMAEMRWLTRFLVVGVAIEYSLTFAHVLGKSCVRDVKH